jgi:hypothetical protein
MPWLNLREEGKRMTLFELVKSDIAVLANIALVLFDALSVAFALALIYIISLGRPYRILKSAQKSVTTFTSKTQLLFRLISGIGLIVVIAGVTLYIAHIIVSANVVLAAAACLAVGALLCGVAYFIFIRPVIRRDDVRIAMTMLVWAALTLLTITALIVMWLARDHLTLNIGTPLSINVVAQIASVAVAAVSILFAYVMRSEEANRTAKQGIYQALELRSIDLFRFEADHPNLVHALWFKPHAPVPETEEERVQKYMLKEYICQILNLFEMALRFRIQGIMAPDVFGSWVIWMWELCSSPVFREFWNDKADMLPANYVAELRAAIQLGVDLYHEQAEPRAEDYFARLADEIMCPEIEPWLKEDYSGSRRK